MSSTASYASFKNAPVTHATSMQDEPEPVPTKSYCSRMLETVGLTYFLPASYVEAKKKQQRLDTLIRFREILRDRERTFEAHVQEYSNVKTAFDNAKGFLTNAYALAKTTNDFSEVEAMKIRVNQKRTELVHIWQKMRTTESEIGKARGYINLLEMDEIMSRSYDADKIVHDYISAGPKQSAREVAKKEKRVSDIMSYNSDLSRDPENIGTAAAQLEPLSTQDYKEIASMDEIVRSCKESAKYTVASSARIARSSAPPQAQRQQSPRELLTAEDDPESAMRQ